MVAANARPQTTKGGSVVLKSGNKRHTLVSTTGERTNLGEYYEQKTANELPGGWVIRLKLRFVKATLNTSRCEMGRSVLSADTTQLTTTISLQSLARLFVLVSRETMLCKSLLR